MPEFSFLSKDTPIDPKKALALAQQQALARSLMDEGSKPLDLNNRSIGGVGYAISPFEALGKALQSGLGAYEQKDVNQKYESEVSDYQKAMANALKGGTLDSMIAASAQSPQLMEFGKDLAMSKAKSDYEVNKLMAIEQMKSNMDPNKRFGNEFNNNPAYNNGGVSSPPPPSSPLLQDGGALPAPSSPLLNGGGGAQLPPVSSQPPSVGQMTGAAASMAGPMNASSLAPPPGSPYAAMGASVPGSFDNTQAAPPQQQPAQSVSSVTPQDAAYNAKALAAGYKPPEGMMFTENGIKRAPPGMSDIANLRKGYASEAGDFADITKNFSRLDALYKAPPSGAGDLGMIFSYMKTLDPRSVVREGEQATASNTGGVPASVWGLYNQALNGQRLSPEVRDNIYKSSVSILQGSQQQNKPIADSYRGMAKRYGIPEEDIVVNYDAGIKPVTPEEIAAKNKASVNQQNPDASNTKTINGQSFVKINGQWFHQ